MFLKTLFSLIFLASITQSAYGYIDPGTGSYIIQLLIAGVATSLYAVKYFWSSIKIFFGKFSKKKKNKKGTFSAPPPPSTPLHAKKK